MLAEDRPAYRPYRVGVHAVRPLSEHFVRVTFTGTDLDVFGTEGLDQRIKLLFPLPATGLADIETDGDWYAHWRSLPDERRNPFRTYTVRAIRPDDRELDVDFVVHADGGPAAQWLAGASAGAEVIVIGPDARSAGRHTGIDWRPGTATDVLLVGDAAALPAISSILETLADDVSATAFVAADPLPIDTKADVSFVAPVDLEAAVRDWITARPGARVGAPQPVADVDVDAELLWESPDEFGAGSCYAWLAGEAALIKSLRRVLVTECGMDRTRVAFMGYWRRGRAELQ